MAFLDIFTNVAILIVFVICLVVSLFIFEYFQSVDEKIDNKFIFMKYIIIFNFSIIFFSPFIIFIHYANSKRLDSLRLNVNSELIEKIFTIIAIVNSIFILPILLLIYRFSISKINKLRYIFYYSLYFLIYIVIVVLNIYSKIHFQRKAFILNQDSFINSSSKILTKDYEIKTDYIFDEIHLDIWTILISPIYYLGIFFFAVFGASGLSILPLDLFFNYIYRPKKNNPNDQVMTKRILLDLTSLLIDKGEEISQQNYELKKNDIFDKKVLKRTKLTINQNISNMKHEFLKFKNIFEVYSLNEYETLKNFNPLFAFIGFILSIFLFIFSLTLIGHSIFYFSDSNITLDNIFKFICDKDSTTAFTLITFLQIYLIFCIARGIKLLTFFNYSFNDLTLRKNETFLNNIVLNGILILISSIGMITYISINFKKFLYYINTKNYINNIIINHSLFKYIFQFKIIELIMLFFFIYSIFLNLLRLRESKLLKRKIKKFKEDFEKKKLDLDKQKHELNNKNTTNLSFN